MLTKVSAGTAAVAGTVALGATAVSVKAYTAVSATALGNYLWHNPDVGLDAYGLGSDVYHGNWGNLPTDILAFAYNGANYQSYKTARTQSYTYSAEPTDVQKNYKAAIADAGSSMGVGEVNVNKAFTDEPVSWNATEGAGNAAKNGEFSIINWDNYPNNLPKPDGPFRLIEGVEYDTARGVANQTNQAMHTANPTLKGMQIHEIHPVKFGGSAADISNKIPLTPSEHAKATTWWRMLQKDLQK